MSFLEIVLALGFVVVDADMLDGLSQRYGEGVPVAFRVAEMKADGIGPRAFLVAADFGEVLAGSLGPPVTLPSIGRFWLLGFKDDPSAGFCIELVGTGEQHRVVKVSEWGYPRWRYWSPEEARPLSVALLTAVEELTAPSRQLL